MDSRLMMTVETPLITAIHKLSLKQNLASEESCSALLQIMEGEATPAQIAAFATALRIKGETVEETLGCVEAMRSKMLRVSPTSRPLLDTCGTGGSLPRVFNVSTTAAFAAAAAGIGIAKHGNRAMSGVSGSADVLETLGVNLSLSPEQIAECIDTVGVGFLFAPQHHPAMRHAAPIRREIRIRTIFNLLGPLTNPADAELRVMGVYDPALCSLAANVLKKLGVRRALVVYGEAGLVEISTIGSTLVYELREGEIESYTLSPQALGLTGIEPTADLIAPSNDPGINAQYVLQALEGVDDTPASRARRDLVAVNLAASLRVAGECDGWKEAVEMAQAILSDKSGLKSLNDYIAFSGSFSNLMK